MNDRLTRVEIDEAGLPPPSADLDQERRIAVFDLMEVNAFALADGPEGPYGLRLGLSGRRLAFTVTAATGDRVDFIVALAPLDQAVKDYATLCDTYAEAVKSLPPARIEAIDAARREIHLEAARQLQALLAERVSTDEATARRLFTLVCALVARD